MATRAYQAVGALRGVGAFVDHLRRLALNIPCDRDLLAGKSSPLAAPLRCGDLVIGNRFAIQPMEGWDGTRDGRPSENTVRRWRNFGRSGAKLIWGGEAVAVRHDGRANPNQLLLNDANLADVAALRGLLLDAHRERFGRTDDLLVGLQLTHSGRFSRPDDKRLRPRVAYRH